jgi:hypothetical protein
MTDDTDRYYSPADVGRLIGRSTRWVETRIAAGEIKAERFEFGGGRTTTRVPRAEYLAWLASKRVA